MHRGHLTATQEAGSRPARWFQRLLGTYPPTARMQLGDLRERAMKTQPRASGQPMGRVAAPTLKTVPGNAVLQHVDLRGVRPTGHRAPEIKKREGGRREVDALVKRMTREAQGALPGTGGQLSAFGGTTVMRSGSPPCLQMTLVVRKLRKGVHGGESCSTGTTVSELACHSARWHWTGEEGRSACPSRPSVLTQPRPAADIAHLGALRCSILMR